MANGSLEYVDRVDGRGSKINLHGSRQSLLELLFEPHDPEIVEIVYQRSGPTTEAIFGTPRDWC
jgi:hypothetical protein